MAPSILSYMALGAFVRYFQYGLTGRKIYTDGIPLFLYTTGWAAICCGGLGYGINKLAETKKQALQRKSAANMDA
ncbi:hypothetical protein V1505DRAFT_391387 [Lipomyces doorenjongii]|uniref:uncharacterized protein n=1 Tax=Lipomyces doorenjongii TaxID=383834 RepID=UPI003342ECB0